MNAHLTYPAEAIDERIWRVAGSPLVQSSHTGPLDGLSVAVKDLFAVRGFAIGAGNPCYLKESPVQKRNAAAVQQLLDGGASVTGIAQTDEFAYSLAGTNIHYGTPPNPQAPGRISGGSSSGPASAVSTGQADIGLGSDTAGSIRIPAAYQGLWGIRTTHDRISREGVHPLSDSFDTVGCLTRDARTLAIAMQVLLPDDDWAELSGGVAICSALDGCAQPDVRETFSAWKETSFPGFMLPEIPFTAEMLDEWLAIFNVVRGYEAWRADGEWVSGHLGSLAPEIAARFERDSHITVEMYEQARGELRQARAWIRRTLGGHALAMPTASSVAPLIDPGPDGLTAIEEARAQTLRLTGIAGIGGLPAVSIPCATASGLPCGVCLIGPAGSDKALIALAADL